MEPGMLVNGHCFSIRKYGNEVCSRHDIVADPSCSLDLPLGLRPAYCDDPFCYVDMEKCSTSKEQYYRSTFVSTSPYSERGRQVQLFYSYSTCNSTADDWRSFSTSNIFGQYNRTLRVTLPALSPMLHYKKNAEGGILDSSAAEYYDDNHPWVGYTIDYFNEILAISNIVGVQYTFRSRGSDEKGIRSQWTRAVSEVASGISDLSISSFWATTER